MDIPLITITLVALAGVLYAISQVSFVLKSLHRQPEHQAAFLFAPLNKFRLGLAFLSLGLAFFLGLCWLQARQANQTQVEQTRSQILAAYDTSAVWQAPDPYLILKENNKDLILYGRQLIANTSDFLGPRGTVRRMSNGMNCQNCHLDAGTKPFGNNYSAVFSTYPKFRARSGSEEDITKRINDCFLRSLNGNSLQPDSREMKAITAYIHWLGQAVPKNKIPLGSGLVKVDLLQRPADPEKGKVVYLAKCQSCHGAQGQGLPMPEDPLSTYPPLWGDGSYNEGAGLYRLSAFAGYVKANMPFGASKDNPQLTDEEAWDLAAFVNSQPRPKHPFLDTDRPVISKKPYDHPFGPFADSFSLDQHKYGPFQPIIAFQKSMTK